MDWLQRIRRSSDTENAPRASETEPAGRDDRGVSPIDAFNDYIRARHALEVWATASQRPISDFNARFDEIRRRFLTESAQARAAKYRGTFQDPPEFDPSRVQIANVERVGPNRVRIVVIHRDPSWPGAPRELLEHRMRYDLAKSNGERRIENRLALLDGRQPIGGLF